MVLFAINLATCKVEIFGIHAQPNGPWLEPMARNVSGGGGFLSGKKHLIHDRDPLYTDNFDNIMNGFIRASIGSLSHGTRAIKATSSALSDWADCQG
jgi:hypothetical protein